MAYVRCSDDLHTEIKKEAAGRKRSMQDLVAEAWDAYLKARSIGEAPSGHEGAPGIPLDLLRQITQEATDTGKPPQDLLAEAWASYMHIKKGISRNDLTKIVAQGIDSHEIMKETERIRGLALEIEKRSATVLQIVGEKEALISGDNTGIPEQPAPDKEGEDQLRELERIRAGVDSGTRRTKKAKSLLEESERADEGADSKVS